MNSNQSARWFIVCCLFCIAIGGCGLPPTSGAFPITVRAQHIILEWDPPNPQFPTPSLLVSHYRIYFRPHGTATWQFLQEVTATGSPRLGLDHSDFGNGSFDFAVSVVSLSGGESDLHTSLDASADPYGGWYLDWTAE